MTYLASVEELHYQARNMHSVDQQPIPLPPKVNYRSFPAAPHPQVVGTDNRLRYILQ